MKMMSLEYKFIGAICGFIFLGMLVLITFMNGVVRCNNNKINLTV